MPRKKTDRKIGKTPHEKIKEGFKLIRLGVSIRKVSKTCEVPFATPKYIFGRRKMLNH